MTDTADDVAIRDLLETRAAGVRAKDARAALAVYAPDITTYDLPPPLRSDAAHVLDPAGLQGWFQTWDGPIGQEYRDLDVTAEGDLAFAHGLLRISGNKVDGGATSTWTRQTVCLRRLDGGWRIVHEHTSVPFYMDGCVKAAVDLEP